MTKEEKKDELKNRISMALKDPILQQGFEIICKNLTDLENKIADIKANCDLAIEGRDVRIMELEKENERLKGDLELWESGGCRATNLFECGVAKELREQLTKAKEIIRTFLNMPMPNNEEVFADVGIFLTKAVQFLKEIEK